MESAPVNIHFNGRDYSSPEAMPENVRAAYQKLKNTFADRDGNGVADIFEDGSAEATRAHVLTPEELSRAFAKPPTLKAKTAANVFRLARILKRIFYGCMILVGSAGAITAAIMIWENS